MMEWENTKHYRQDDLSWMGVVMMVHRTSSSIKRRTAIAAKRPRLP